MTREVANEHYQTDSLKLLPSIGLMLHYQLASDEKVQTKLQIECAVPLSSAGHRASFPQPRTALRVHIRSLEESYYTGVPTSPAVRSHSLRALTRSENK